MIKNTTPSSGSFRALPSILPAPPLLSWDDAGIAQIRNIFCYVQRHYTSGFVLLYTKLGADVSIQAGDWAGNKLDLSDSNRSQLAAQAVDFIDRNNSKIYTLLSTIGLPQAQLFLDANSRLTDLQTNIDKLVGPGMLQNLFERIVETTETIKIEVIDQRAIDAITAGTGDYAGNLILKPSKFRHVELPNGKLSPLYVQVVR